MLWVASCLWERFERMSVCGKTFRGFLSVGTLWEVFCLWDTLKVSVYLWECFERVPVCLWECFETTSVYGNTLSRFLSVGMLWENACLSVETLWENDCLPGNALRGCLYKCFERMSVCQWKHFEWVSACLWECFERMSVCANALRGCLFMGILWEGVCLPVCGNVVGPVLATQVNDPTWRCFFSLGLLRPKQILS